MNTHYVFPTPFYEFDLSEHLDQILELVPQEKNLINPHYPMIVQSTDQALHKQERWKFLTDKVEECLQEIQDSAGYDPAFGHFKLTRLWTNVTLRGSGGSHSQHRHPMSFFSGVLYLTEGESTKFLDPCRTRSIREIDVPCTEHFNDLLIKPVPGMMVVFPSYIEHLTIGHWDQDVDRITMAWNCLPENMVP